MFKHERGRLHGGRFDMQVQLLHSFSAPLFKLAIPWEGEKKNTWSHVYVFFVQRTQSYSGALYFRKTLNVLIQTK
jgi:hypothetical protein